MTIKFPLGTETCVDIPPGHIASVITYLRRTVKPTGPLDLPHDIDLKWGFTVKLAAYRDLFRHVGASWLWYSRLRLGDSELRDHFSAANVHFGMALKAGRPAGFIELIERDGGELEVVFLGVLPEHSGAGVGRLLLENGLWHYWREKTNLARLQTCTLDDPRAIGFYQKMGFVPIKRALEVSPDPRLNGLLPADCRPDYAIV